MEIIAGGQPRRKPFECGNFGKITILEKEIFSNASPSP